VTDEPASPGREIVRAPQAGYAGSRSMPDVSDLQSGNRYGEVLIAGLIRAQLGLTLGFLALTVAVIGSLPLVATLVPSVDHDAVLGLPIPLIVLGAAIYPILVIFGWTYVHLSDRLERRFADLLNRLS
jgi:hypothetical protein